MAFGLLPKLCGLNYTGVNLNRRDTVYRILLKLTSQSFLVRKYQKIDVKGK